MLRAYLGGLTTGRLGRLSFLGFWVLLWVLCALYGLGIAFGLGVVEPLVFEGPWSAREQLLTHFGLPVLAALVLGGLLVVFAQFNLVAKRIRDMGLPGWTVLLVIALGSAALAYILPPGGELMRLENRINGGFNGLLTLALLLIPGGVFARRAAPAPAEDTDTADSGTQAAVPAADLAEAGTPMAPVSEAEPQPESAPDVGPEESESATSETVPVPGVEPVVEPPGVSEAQDGPREPGPAETPTSGRPTDTRSDPPSP